MQQSDFPVVDHAGGLAGGCPWNWVFILIAASLFTFGFLGVWIGVHIGSHRTPQRFRACLDELIRHIDKLSAAAAGASQDRLDADARALVNRLEATLSGVADFGAPLQKHLKALKEALDDKQSADNKGAAGDKAATGPSAASAAAAHAGAHTQIIVHAAPAPGSEPGAAATAVVAEKVAPPPAPPPPPVLSRPQRIRAAAGDFRDFWSAEASQRNLHKARDQLVCPAEVPSEPARH